MIGPDVVPTHIIHDDSADLHHADLHLISDLFWMGRLIADPDVSSSNDCDACGGSRVFHGELCPQCT